MGFQTLYNTANLFTSEPLRLLLTVTDIIVCRLEIFIKAFPLFGLSLMIFLTDGLVYRDIRKFQAGRESTIFFHRAKLLMSFCLFIPLFFYLSLPIFISPMLIFIGQSLMLGISVKFAALYFKKYI
mgnify:CR=1 FL=1